MALLHTLGEGVRERVGKGYVPQQKTHTIVYLYSQEQYYMPPSYNLMLVSNVKLLELGLLGNTRAHRNCKW